MKPRFLTLVALLCLGAMAMLLPACGGDGDSETATAAEGDKETASAECEPTAEVETLEEGKLKVVGFELPPYTSFGGGTPSGTDVDIIERIADELCLDLEITEAASAAVIPAVETGRADIAIGDWNRTKEREEIINQTDPMYLDLVGFASKEGISNPEELADKNVASVAGAYWNDELAEVSGDLKLYQSWGQLYDDLLSGRVDVGVTSYAQANYTLEDQGGDLQVKVAEANDAFGASTQPGQADLPHRLGNETMKKALNELIAELKSDGFVAEVLEKYGLDPSAAETGPPTFK